MPEDKRLVLLNAVHILDRSPTIEDLLPKLRHEVRLAARREHVDPFIRRLEGWWFSVVVRHLSSPGAGTILVEEIESQIADLREQFKCDNLPIDFLNAEPPEPLDPENDPRVFVAQLRLISLANPRIEFAIRDFYRAFQQRSRWVREDLLLVGELETYERRLVEEWERRFHVMKEGLEGAAANEQKITAGRSLYNWVETGAQIEIRRECREPYVMRGSYQILSDQRRVGWHLASRIRRASPDLAQGREMSPMKAWQERTAEEAHLLNPAFSGLLITRAVDEYTRSAAQPLPYALAFLVLPVVLHKRTREALPGSVSTSLAVWLQAKPETRVGFAARTRALLPFTREAIAFLLARGVLIVAEAGGLGRGPTDVRGIARVARMSDEVASCITSAQLVGRWFARSGSPHSIIALWGLRP
ncbi:MAG: ABC-three component system protein [Gammaproteobacteria bacterium]